MTHVEINTALLDELRMAHQIIRNGLRTMNTGQQNTWGRRNAEDGVDGEGITRANERMAVILAAEQVSS